MNESPCTGGRGRHITHREPKRTNEKLPSLIVKKSIADVTQLNNSSKPDKRKKVTITSVEETGFQKGNQVGNRKIKPTSNVNRKLKTNNTNNNKTVQRISSKVVFNRTFFKYDDVQRKLKAKFQSAYKSNGKFDPNSTKYKAYINKKLNKKNKLLLKYSTCNAKKIKTNKRIRLCSDLPGKGTYNHRFAYDDALQLHKKGIDVDVLYKVKNKTDSVYVINGEFVWSKNKRSDAFSSLSNRNADDVAKSQTSIEEEALGSKELDKIQKVDKETEKNLRQHNAEREKRNKEMESKLLAEKLDRHRMLRGNEAKQNYLEEEEEKEMKTRLRETKQKMNDEQTQKDIEYANAEIEKQKKRLEFRQYLTLKLKKIKANAANKCNKLQKEDTKPTRNICDKVRNYFLSVDPKFFLSHLVIILLLYQLRYIYVICF